MTLTKGQINYRRYRESYRRYSQTEKCREIVRRSAKIYYRNNLQKIMAKRIERNFGNLREIAILRDGSKCLNCGITREEHKQQFQYDITVDHIDGKGRNTKLKNHKLNNLQTLCTRCHGQKDSLSFYVLRKLVLFTPIFLKGGDF